MKGLKINYKGKNTIAAVKDGDLLVVDMHDVRGESFFYAGSVDYDEQLGRVWYPIVPIELGDTFEFEVVETTEATKGNTTNNALKDATIETGYVVKVPMFISQGEHIIISTKDGKYSSRA